MIETFKNYLAKNRGLSEKTVDAYEEALRHFAKYINSNYSGVRWSTMTKGMIDEYVEYMVMEEYKPASIKQHIAALRTFYKTCMALGTMTDNPARYVSTPKLGTQLPKVIETEAIKNCLACDAVNPTAKAVIAIIFETGIRLQELLDMRPCDVNPKNQSIRIHGKGNKDRVVYYGELSKMYGRTFHGKEHTQREIRHLVFNALKPFSKAPQLSPHAIRHTYASLLIDNGMSIEAISKLMGHEHIATTELYAKMSNGKAKEMYLEFRPQLGN